MNKYEIIQEEIETKVKAERKDNNSFIQIRSARLREIQDPENPIHAKHEIELIVFVVVVSICDQIVSHRSNLDQSSSSFFNMLLVSSKLFCSFYSIEYQRLYHYYNQDIQFHVLRELGFLGLEFL